VFKSQTAKEAANTVSYWRKQSDAFKLQSAYYLSLRTYGYDPADEPRLDRTAFSMRKRYKVQILLPIIFKIEFVDIFILILISYQYILIIISKLHNRKNYWLMKVFILFLFIITFLFCCKQVSVAQGLEYEIGIGPQITKAIITDHSVGIVGNQKPLNNRYFVGYSLNLMVRNHASPFQVGLQLKT
jgi:hypothetical protein